MVSLGNAYRLQGRTLSPGEALRTWVAGHSNILRRIADHLGVSNDPHWMAAPALRRRPAMAEAEAAPPTLGHLWDQAELQPDLVLQALELGWQLGYA